MQDWVKELILEKYTPVLSQEPHLYPDDYIKTIESAIESNQIRLIGNEKMRSVIMIVRQTAFVCSLYMFSDCKEPFKLVRFTKQAIRWIWKNTSFLKVEASATNTKVANLLTRCGFGVEGIRVQSFVNLDGGLSDTMIFGLVRADEEDETEN